MGEEIRSHRDRGLSDIKSHRSPMPAFAEPDTPMEVGKRPRAPSKPKMRLSRNSNQETVSRDSTLSSANPMFMPKRASRFQAIKGKREPLFDVASDPGQNDDDQVVTFPSAKAAPGLSLAGAGQDYDEKAGRYAPTPPSVKRGEATPPKRSSSYFGRRLSQALYTPRPPPPRVVAQKIAHFFDDDDADFKRDEVEDLDYDDEFKRIEKLPWREKIWAKKMVQRLIMGLFAVTLLWATSLGFVRFIIEDFFFPSPTFTEVYDGFVAHFEYVDDEKNAYGACSNQVFDLCTVQYNDAHQEMIFFTNRNTTQNALILQQDEIIRSTAKSELNDTLNALIAIVDAGVLLADALVTTNISVCPRVINWVNGQVASALAANTFQVGTNATDEAVASILEQIAARNAYDQEYMANKTQQIKDFHEHLAELQENETAAVMDQLDAAFGSYFGCIAGSSCGNGNSVLGTLNGFQDAISADAANMASIVGVSDVEFDDLIRKFNEIQNLVIGFQETTGIDFIGGTGITIDSNTGNAVPASPGTITIPTFVSEALELDQIENIATTIFEEGSQAVNATQTIAGDAASNFTSTITNQNLTTIEPYDPPAVDETPKTDWESVRDANTEAFNSLMETFTSAQAASTEDDFVPPSQTQTNFPDAPEDIVTVLPSREFALFSYSASLFEDITLRFTLAFNLMTYADVMYRVVHTVLIINKYWNLSAIGKPPGDARVDEISGRKWGVKASADQKIAKLITHPVVINIVSLTFVILLTLIGWRAYEPFFRAYVDGCVEHSGADIEFAGTSNGTMIFRNLFSMSFSYMVSVGDSIQTTQVDKLNVLRETDCEANFQNTSEIFNNSVTSFNAISADYQKTLNFRAELLDCLDFTELDTAVFNFTEALAHPSFTEGLTVISADAVYNCAAIPSCETDCPDPDNRRLANECHDHACAAELWMHAKVLGIVMVLFTFIILQISRISFVRSVVRLWWRQLNPYDFTFLGSCTREGHHIDPQAVSEDGETYQDTVADAVHKAIRNWEKMGYVNMAYSILLNAPWIAVCVFLSRSIEGENYSG